MALQPVPEPDGSQESDQDSQEIESDADGSDEEDIMDSFFLCLLKGTFPIKMQKHESPPKKIQQL